MLTASNVSVMYDGGRTVVDGVSLILKDGENVALVGANGAGKTTLLHALVGVLPLSSGEVVLDGVGLEKRTQKRFRSSVGLVFQNPDDQLFMPNIYEDLAFGPRAHDVSEPEVALRVSDILARLGIAHLSGSSPLKLSGGERRLCAIAAVLTLDPQFLLLDEPTAFLDPKARRNLSQILTNLPQGKLVTTHDLPFAKSFCSRVIILKNGKVLHEGGIETLDDSKMLDAAGL